MVQVIGVKLPLVKPSDDIAELIVKGAEECGAGICDGDVLVVAEKVVSKALGLMVIFESIKPSKEALRLSKKTGLDPRFVELVIRECDRILATVPIKKIVESGAFNLLSLSSDKEATKRLLEEYPCFFIVEKEGMLWSDSGIDSSNAPEGVYVVPPRSHDEVARKIHERIRELTGKYVAVIISDTEAFLGGSMDFARGGWGMDPVDRLFSVPDLYGKPKYGGVDLVAHELCSAASLVLKQSSEGVPAAIIRGLNYRRVERGLTECLPNANLEKALALTVAATVKTLGVWKLVRLLFKTLLRVNSQNILSCYNRNVGKRGSTSMHHRFYTVFPRPTNHPKSH